MDWKDAISDAIAFAAVVLSVLSFRKSAEAITLARRREIDEPWILQIIPLQNWLTACLEYDQASRAIRFVSVTASEPRGLQLQHYAVRMADPTTEDIQTRRRRTFVVPDEAGPREILAIGRDMNPRTISGGTVQMLLLMPRRPFWSTTVGTSVRLAVRYEELDAKRTRREVDVWAHDVPWAE